jgi:lipopolysaccharide export system protein LptC
MPKRLRYLLTLLSALLLVALLWRSPPNQLKDLLAEGEAKPRTPISYLTGAHTTQFSAEGKISHTVESAITRFYEPAESDNTNPPPSDVTFDQPVITIFSETDKAENTPPWIISSDFGEGSEKNDEFWLKGNVNMQQTRNPREQSRLSTSELLIKPEQHYAETDKPVIITDPAGSTRATGAKVFFDDERIEFLSNVKGQYNPQ